MAIKIGHNRQNVILDKHFEVIIMVRLIDISIAKILQKIFLLVMYMYNANIFHLFEYMFGICLNVLYVNMSVIPPNFGPK